LPIKSKTKTKQGVKKHFLKPWTEDNHGGKVLNQVGNYSFSFQLEMEFAN
jgi:hypothetical protein